MNRDDLTAKNAKSAKEELLFKDECYVIQGAIFDVYREMGCGFLEAVYQECLEKEFRSRQLPFEAQKELILVSFWEWEKNPRLQAKTSVGLRYYGILS